MEKCLVTKLKAATNNTSLLKVGELRVNILDNNADNSSLNIQIKSSNKNELEIIGDGYFTNQDYSANLGKKITVVPNAITNIHFSSDVKALSINDKYSLTIFSNSIVPAAMSGSFKSINIKDFAYSDNLEELYLAGCPFSGDLAAVSKLSKLKKMNISASNIKGDISLIKELALESFWAVTGGITGDVDNLKNMPLSLLSFSNLSGDLKSLGSVNTLTTIQAVSENVICTDIAAFINCNNLKTLWIKNSKNILGDLSKLPSNINLITTQNSTANFTWTERTSEKSLFSIEGNPSVANIDKLLQDLSDCVVPVGQSIKIISVKGSRTSASDEAVSKLQSKGYTVSIIA